jgi:GPH family glycoside/pentoside/hexuronide:cation symporter
MIYFIEAQAWAKAANVKLFYFSSFDETWKIRFEGGAGTSWRLGM